MHSIRWRHPWLVCCAAIACAAAAAAGARDDGRFEIRNAYVELKDEAWELDVRLDLALADAAQQAFDEGVPLVLEIEAEASVSRRLLPDETVVALKREWQLAYDAIAERYVVTDMATAEQASHASKLEALESLTRVSAITFADAGTLRPDRRFNMRVRATVEIGELPAAIKMLLFWKSWSRSTDWYAWKVRP